MNQSTLSTIAITCVILRQEALTNGAIFNTHSLFYTQQRKKYTFIFYILCFFLFLTIRNDYSIIVNAYSLHHSGRLGYVFGLQTRESNFAYQNQVLAQ